jgi:hypothetical protein
MQKAVSECRCLKPHAEKKSKTLTAFLPVFFIALIPKCPFCILTYTSAITICSTNSLGNHAPQWTSWISIGFAMLTFLVTLYNNKGRRTLVAAAFILVGSLLIIYSELISGLLTPYYWGCGVLIFGIWVNGSLPYFIRHIFPSLEFKTPSSFTSNN